MYATRAETAKSKIISATKNTIMDGCSSLKRLELHVTRDSSNSFLLVGRAATKK